MGKNTNNTLGTSSSSSTISNPEKVIFPEGTRIVDFKVMRSNFALDSDGNLWRWGWPILMEDAETITKPEIYKVGVKDFIAQNDGLLVHYMNGDISVDYRFNYANYKKDHLGLGIESVEFAQSINAFFLKDAGNKIHFVSAWEYDLLEEVSDISEIISYNKSNFTEESEFEGEVGYSSHDKRIVTVRKDDGLYNISVRDMEDGKYEGPEKIEEFSSEDEVLNRFVGNGIEIYLEPNKFCIRDFGIYFIGH